MHGRSSKDVVRRITCDYVESGVMVAGFVGLHMPAQSCSDFTLTIVLHLVTMIEVILLEDEEVLQAELCEFLSSCGYLVEVASTLQEFHQRFEPARHGLALLDIGLPDGDGMALVRELRARSERIGIVVFTARGGQSDRVSGLDLGADYYLTKTADLEELAATLKALVRRLQASGPQLPDVWVLEPGQRNLIAPGGVNIALSEQDLVVLKELMSHAGQLVSRRQIIEALGEDFISYDQRRLDTQMRRLRRKVDEYGLTLPVTTARSAGYRFYAKAMVWN